MVRHGCGGVGKFLAIHEPPLRATSPALKALAFVTTDSWLAGCRRKRLSFVCFGMRAQ